MACITTEQAMTLAHEWVSVWNRHDLEVILSHYAPDIDFSSPFIVKLLNKPDGTIRGIEALRDYFSKGLAAYPALEFTLYHVLTGVSSIVLYYRSVNNLLATEMMELDNTGKIKRV